MQKSNNNDSEKKVGDTVIYFLRKILLSNSQTIIQITITLQG